jgi:hypothetical protein
MNRPQRAVFKSGIGRNFGAVLQVQGTYVDVYFYHMYIGTQTHLHRKLPSGLVISYVGRTMVLSILGDSGTHVVSCSSLVGNQPLVRIGHTANQSLNQWSVLGI